MNSGRQPMLTVAIGETGIGKTVLTIKEALRYVSGNPLTGKKGRPVLAVDFNDDDYPHFSAVKIKDLPRLITPQLRRIRPINDDGTTMSIMERKDALKCIVRKFKNGLLIIDDVDKTNVGAKDQATVGLLTANRHDGLDILVTHQSISKITPTEWENCTWLRMQHTVDDPKKYKNRIPNYFIVKIGKLIIDEQYDKANNEYSRGLISESDYKKRKSFHIYINMRNLKIMGCSIQAFYRACKKYLYYEEQSKIRDMVSERDLNDKPLYRNKKEVVLKLIKEYGERYYYRVTSKEMEIRQVA